MTATATVRKVYRVHGTTDDVATCDLCGREDLKSTVIMIELDEAGNELDAVYMGTDCAAKAAGWTQKDVKAKLKVIDDAAKRELAKRERQIREERSRREAAAFADWAATKYGVTVKARFEQVSHGDVYDALL